MKMVLMEKEEGKICVKYHAHKCVLQKLLQKHLKCFLPLQKLLPLDDLSGHLAALKKRIRLLLQTGVSVNTDEQAALFVLLSCWPMSLDPLFGEKQIPELQQRLDIIIQFCVEIIVLFFDYGLDPNLTRYDQSPLTFLFKLRSRASQTKKVQQMIQLFILNGASQYNHVIYGQGHCSFSQMIMTIRRLPHKDYTTHLTSMIPCHLNKMAGYGDKAVTVPSELTNEYNILVKMASTPRSLLVQTRCVILRHLAKGSDLIERIRHLDIPFCLKTELLTVE